MRDITGSTGLELKADPGVPYVYVGMGVLMVTTALSYLSFTEFWALTDGGKLYAGGRTNRAKKEFKREFSELVRWQDPRASPPNPASSACGSKGSCTTWGSI